MDRDGYLWFLSDKYGLYFIPGAYDYTKFNIYLYRISVEDAIEGTVCENNDKKVKLGAQYDDGVISEFITNFNGTQVITDSDL